MIGEVNYYRVSPVYTAFQLRIDIRVTDIKFLRATSRCSKNTAGSKSIDKQ